MRIAICDDDVKDLALLQAHLKDFDQSETLEVLSYTSAAQLYAARTRKPFDIAILDIEMEAPNGYEIAKSLMLDEPPPIIIFLTNSMAYSLRGYGIAFRYLAKPINQCELHSALSAALVEAASKRFVLSLEGASHVFPISDIFYFEVFNHHTILHTMDQSYTFRATLKDILAKLPLGYFGSPHQSYIVNFNHIKTAMPKELHLTNGAVIPISRRKQQEFDTLFRAFLRR